ncbi:hypothetical protein WA026_010941 [Henosepilachna vigintioctopunctata]|uniref:Uncharacterized protein n=1 Tax=Henosepilachna vigintioctopunctata TaxID=420089 RepID=A0AAW1USE8_9CUCU
MSIISLTNRAVRTVPEVESKKDCPLMHLPLMMQSWISSAQFDEQIGRNPPEVLFFVFCGNLWVRCDSSPSEIDSSIEITDRLNFRTCYTLSTHD